VQPPRVVPSAAGCAGRPPSRETGWWDGGGGQGTVEEVPRERLKERRVVDGEWVVLPSESRLGHGRIGMHAGYRRDGIGRGVFSVCAAKSAAESVLAGAVHRQRRALCRFFDQGCV
jgi:hypothetical protein